MNKNYILLFFYKFKLQIIVNDIQIIIHLF